MRPPGDSYWVEEGRFLAGPYPGDPDAARERERLGAFLDFGVRRFVDLTEPGEHHPYAPILRRVASQRPFDVDHVRLAIPDKSVPTRRRMRGILDVIDADLDEGESVYLHCRGGAGRTGTVVGCFLIERGLEPDDALAQITADRSGIASRRGHWSSPETDEQRRFVLEWRPGGG
jgi:protein-tyrosine phosphatase